MHIDLWRAIKMKKENINIDYVLDSVAKIYSMNLHIAAKYLLIYECFRNKTIDTVRNFFAEVNTTKRSGSRIVSKESNEYLQALKLNSKKSHRLLKTFEWASSLGLMVNLDKANEIIKYRNHIAHEITNTLDDADFFIKTDNLIKIMIEIGSSFQKWWIINFESQRNPDLENIVINDNDVSTDIEMIYDLINR